MDSFIYLKMPSLIDFKTEGGVDFFEVFKEARPFIIHQSFLLTDPDTVGNNTDLTNKVQPTRYPDMGVPLDLPFETTIFQFLDNCPMSIRTPNGPTLHNYVFLVHELFFNKYAYHMLVTQEKDPLPFLSHHKDGPEIRFIVSKFLNYLKDQTGKMANLRTNDRVKVRINGVNQIHKIKDVVVLFPKEEEKNSIYKGLQIDWSHRWEVRGHWRKVSGIGKNRNGDYVIPQHTWVKDFVKGPENKVLIKKKRVLLRGPMETPNPSH